MAAEGDLRLRTALFPATVVMSAWVQVMVDRWDIANLVLATADLHALLRDLLLDGGRSCPAPRRLGAPLLGQRGVGVQLGVLHNHAGVLTQIDVITFLDT